jgi:hypothetical protein
MAQSLNIASFEQFSIPSKKEQRDIEANFKKLFKGSSKTFGKMKTKQTFEQQISKYNPKKQEKLRKKQAEIEQKMKTKANTPQNPIKLGERCGGTAMKRSKKDYTKTHKRQFDSINMIDELNNVFGISPKSLALCWKKYFKTNLTGKCKRVGCNNKISINCPILMGFMPKVNKKTFVYHEVPHSYFLIQNTEFHINDDMDSECYDLVDYESLNKLFSTKTKKQIANMLKPVCHCCYEESLNTTTKYKYYMKAFQDIQIKAVSADEYVRRWCEKSKLCQFKQKNGHLCCENVINDKDIYCISCSLSSALSL